MRIQNAKAVLNKRFQVLGTAFELEHILEGHAHEIWQQGGRGVASPALLHVPPMKHGGIPPWVEEVLKRNREETKHMT